MTCPDQLPDFFDFQWLSRPNFSLCRSHPARTMRPRDPVTSSASELCRRGSRFARSQEERAIGAPRIIRVRSKTPTWAGASASTSQSHPSRQSWPSRLRRKSPHSRPGKIPRTLRRPSPSKPASSPHGAGVGGGPTSWTVAFKGCKGLGLRT